MRDRRAGDVDLRAELRDLRPESAEWSRSASGTAVLERLLAVRDLPPTTGRPASRATLGVTLRWGVAALALLMAGVGAVALVTNLGDDPAGLVVATQDQTMKPQIVSGVRNPGSIIDSLPQLVARSTVIVSASVVSAAPGEVLTEFDDESIWGRDVRIDVDQVFMGERLPDEIVIHQGFYADGVGLEFEGQPWVMPGDSIVAFLASPKAVTDPHYEVAAVPGVWTITASGHVSISASDPVARSLDGVEWTTAQQQLRDAIATGEGAQH